MMALNRSPEFSNPKPSAAELLVPEATIWANSEELNSYYAIPYIDFQASEPSRSATEDFFILPMYFYASNPEAPWERPFWILEP